MADADWYQYLSDGQAHVYNIFAAHCPYVLMGAPTLLTSADSNVTYTFGTNVAPLAVELYDNQNGRLLRPGAFWDHSADYCWEGIRIRFPGGVAKTFAGGPYARWITPPTVIDGSTAPTLQPQHARIAVVYHAVWLWATTGGLRDPAPFERLERSYLWGDPQNGLPGIIIALKISNPFSGAEALAGSYANWSQGIDTGSGYVRVS